MAYTRIPGGAWVPHVPMIYPNATNIPNFSDGLTLDADEEEIQCFGMVHWKDRGSHTFGISGSKITWIAGTPITFADDGATDPTLRVGIKKSTSFDLTTGSPARATIGAAAFDVYKDLVGGTDTITAATAHATAMASGTPFTIAQGDMICISFHLDKPGAASQSVKLRQISAAQQSYPTLTIITSGPTYTNGSGAPILALTADDGTQGWLEGSWVQSAHNAENIGNGNIYANIFVPPFNLKVDAIRIHSSLAASTTNPDIGFWSDPFGTPTPVSGGMVNFDVQGSANTRGFEFMLPSEPELSSGQSYALGIKQNAASPNISVAYYDVDVAEQFEANGLDENYYAAKSTFSGTQQPFSSQNSGKRRLGAWLRISQVDFPVSLSGSRVIGG